ncbi:MAG: hypothetical protein HY245_05000 [Rhizobiales bacterium]|nr:hypothetical protein [Hyphomicrobiales bacterium]
MIAFGKHRDEAARHFVELRLVGRGDAVTDVGKALKLAARRRHGRRQPGDPHTIGIDGVAGDTSGVDRG